MPMRTMLLLPILSASEISGRKPTVFRSGAPSQLQHDMHATEHYQSSLGSQIPPDCHSAVKYAFDFLTQLGCTAKSVAKFAEKVQVVMADKVIED